MISWNYSPKMNCDILIIRICFHTNHHHSSCLHMMSTHHPSYLQTLSSLNHFHCIITAILPLSIFFSVHVSSSFFHINTSPYFTQIYLLTLLSFLIWQSCPLPVVAFASIFPKSRFSKNFLISLRFIYPCIPLATKITGLNSFMPS